MYIFGVYLFEFKESLPVSYPFWQTRLLTDLEKLILDTFCL